MLYLLAVMILLSAAAGVLCFVRQDKRMIIWLIAMLVCYASFIFWLLLYVAKDSYYYNIVNRYFGISKGLWKRLAFFPIEKQMIVRLLNQSAILFVGACVSFSWSLGRAQHQRVRKAFVMATLALAVIEIVWYEPIVAKAVYYALYPAYIDAPGYRALEHAVYVAFYVVNILLILSGFVVLVDYSVRIANVPGVRVYTPLVLLCYTIVVGSYLLIGSGLPAPMLQISKAADFVRYRSVPLGQNQFIYSLFPYFIIVAVVGLFLCIFQFLRVQSVLRNEEQTISRQLDASETVTRVFCHYLKNELLVIREYAEELEENPALHQQLSNQITQRCAVLFDRLDEVYNSTRNSRLQLRRCELRQFVDDFCVRMQQVWGQISIQYQPACAHAYCMLDTDYLSEALGNVIRNAVEEIRPLDPSRHEITVKLRLESLWAVIEIIDQGRGIQADDLERLFQPFYSSKPVGTNWGIGLALTHRIIAAHGGRITVDSRVGKGTCFRISLPILDA